MSAASRHGSLSFPGPPDARISSQPAPYLTVLLNEQFDTFMVRAEYFFEPVQCLMERQLPHAADQVVGVGNDLFFRGEGKVILFWKSEALCLRSCYTCTDMTFYDIDKLAGETELTPDLYPGDRVPYSVRP